MPRQDNWKGRLLKAKTVLSKILATWDVSSSDQVGFELLVINHLSLLRQEGIVIEFSQLGVLQALHDTKLKKLPPSKVYEAPSTLYHSLEGLIGHINFDRVGRWRQEDGSMLGSLMNSSTWDSKAEVYLRKVLKNGSGKGNGGIPSGWPTTIFEITWVVTTLSYVGASIPEPQSSYIREFLEENLHSHNGVVDFSGSYFPDADDTAKAIMALRYLGSESSGNTLIKRISVRISGGRFVTIICCSAVPMTATTDAS
ncbi:hypothetical protein F4779DRAFT_108960 [Xylariaceae sp. FL0662B]|nr:hypothetical protein F4779DRAFT_108960 [Xylariaceae sp. FL0662B]